MVLPFMPGDVEGLLQEANDHRLPLEQTVEIARQVCLGLEFAHSKGIIHRDLKPGNVWFTEDGTTKIGDFGLALSTDRSRLTQEGTIVGTCTYMPPEQSMGGEVTTQADLYSLGAMLYEMVTGRPPFVGEDTVAIIGQHLNTPPVAPTWHNSEVPRGWTTSSWVYWRRTQHRGPHLPPRSARRWRPLTWRRLTRRPCHPARPRHTARRSLAARRRYSSFTTLSMGPCRAMVLW